MVYMNQKRSTWKDNKEMEIVLSLLNKDCHPRQLSKELKIPLSSLLRVLKNLQERNIIDYVLQGKNKVYFLKKNLEMLNFVKMAELYKFDKFIFSYPSLGIIMGKILEQTKVRIILLFGSYSKFSAKDSSDIDIYLDTMNNDVKKKISKINSRLSIKIGKFDGQSPLGKEIIKNHVIVRGVEEFYEKNKFFN